MKHAIHDKFSKLLTVILSVMAIAMTACDGKDEPLPEPEPTPEPEITSRTVLVYMVATNNLGTNHFDSYDLNEMQRAVDNGDLGNGRLIVYHATSSGLVLKEIKADKIDTLKVYDNSRLSVSVERMRQVIDDTKEMAKAKDYGLVLWSHATGWIQDGIDEPVTKGYRSYGDDSSNKMNITSLATALEVDGFSFIYFDCCYMGSVEVMYELRKCSPYMVVSAAEDPADGMPYDLNLKNLFDTESTLEVSMINAARTTFDHYNDVFVKGDCPCTMAVVRSDKLERLADVTRRIYAGATTSINLDYNYQRYKVSGVCHYYDYAQYVESICEDEALLAEYHDALSDVVVYADATPWIWSSTPILNYCGLSTYIMSNELSSTNNNYNTLSWYRDVASKIFE